MSTSPWNVEATNSGGGSSEIPPSGNHPAVLVALIDLGTHEDEYQGKKVQNRKALFCWELPTEHKADGTPFILAKDYNVMAKISGKSKLRLMLESWRGQALKEGETVDLSSLLGKCCLLNIGHQVTSGGKTYAAILGLTPPVRGMTIPKPFHEPYSWHLSAGEPLRVPEWVPWLYGNAIEDWVAGARERRSNGFSPGAVVAPAAADVEEIPF
jgi:hypothetical protein